MEIKEAAFPSKEDKLQGAATFSLELDFGVDVGWLPFAVLPFSASFTPAEARLGVCFAIGILEPGLGIPLEAGAALSFLAAAGLFPFGIKLAILELFFGVSTTCSFSSLIVFSVQTLLFSLLLSSFSFGCGKDFLLLRILLPAFGGVNLVEAFGLVLVGHVLFNMLFNPSLSPHSSSISSSRPPSLGGDKEGRKAVRALPSLNFSSMDFCPDEGVLAPSDSGGLSLSEDGVGEVAGLGCFTDSMVEVALCLTFIDLLRQDLLALAEGMAEASCWTGLGGCCCTFPFTPAEGCWTLGESFSLPFT